MKLKPTIFVLGLLLFGLSYSIAQETVILNVPKQLVINAGPDNTINLYDDITIGGTPTAEFGVAPYYYNWTPASFLNNSFIANPIATPEDTIVYTLEVTDSNGCTMTDEVVVNVITIGIDNLDEGQKIIVYPNPVTGNLAIDFNGLKGKINVSILDLQGRIIINEKLNILDNSIHLLDLSEFASGTYALEVNGTDFSVSRKIIKK